MTTTKPPVLTERDIKVAMAQAGFGYDENLIEFARIIEHLALARAGADAVRDAALVRLMPEVLASLKYHGQDVSLVADIERALKGTPAAAATPTNQQISDYLHGLDAVKRQLIEREAGQLSGNAGQVDAEHLARGREIDRACRDLPEGWQVRIELERDAGTAYWLHPYRGLWNYIDSGDSFSSQIKTAIDAAIAASKGANHG